MHGQGQNAPKCARKMQPMAQVNRISRIGLDLIKGFEGLRRRSEPLANSRWIVGYGHTRSAREGVEVTEREAEYLLRYDLQEYEDLVRNEALAPLNQNEFDALVAFAWNVGKDAFRGSDVLKYVSAGEMLAAAESFAAWRKARVGGKLIVVDALVRRRSAEKNLFLSHPSGPPSAPSLIVQPELDVAASVLALSDGALSIEAKLNDPDTPSDRTLLTAIPERTIAESLAADVSDDTKPDEDAELDLADVDEVDVSDLDGDLDAAEQDEDEAQLGSIWDASDLTGDPDIDEGETYTDDDDPDVLDEAMAKILNEDKHEQPVTSVDVLEREEQAAADAQKDDDSDDLNVAPELTSNVDATFDVPEDAKDISDEDETGTPTGDISSGIRDSVVDPTDDLTERAYKEAAERSKADAVFEETNSRVKGTIVDPSYIEAAAEDDTAEDEPTVAEKGSAWIAAVMFGLLALLGAAMMVIGIMEWWNLIRSEVPVDENRLYAGPFLTLIGGFSLAFGTYFLIRSRTSGLSG